MFRASIALAALAAALPYSPAAAAELTASGRASADSTLSGGAAADPVTGSAAAEHPDHDSGDIVVTGTRKHVQDVLGGISILDTGDLTREMRTSIGETLARQPGVSATSFGPAASRPVLRGLSGERVRVLTDGIGSLDMSSSDPDHAVAINQLTADRIEVLRGPSSLLYGSSAIGGVVNVVDTRIPRRLPESGVGGGAVLTLGSAASERSASGQVNVALGQNFVAHVDGSYSRNDDLAIGGHVLSRALRDQAAASADPEIRELADLKGKLPNTSGRIDDIAGGIAYIDDRLNVGLSVSHHDAKYGVPVRYSVDPSIEPEQPTIDAHQDRIDGRAEIPVGGAIRAVNVRAGAARYHHNEIEEDGTVGSRFYSSGQEGRIDIVQSDRGGWGGTSGVQLLRQTARIRGEEKYLPDSRNRQFGLFTVQNLARGKLHAEAGARIEVTRVSAQADEVLAAEPDGDPRVGTTPLARTFTPVSASLGANYEVGGGWRIGLALSHSERAPSIDELYSKGPHGGSQQFLVGDPDLDIEKSNGVELSLNQTSGPVHFRGSLYYSRFSNFIYQFPTGEIADDLPLYESLQGKADYSGFELEVDAKFGQAFGVDWGGELVADATRATIKHFGPAPLIPPLRVLGALTGSRGQVDGRLEVEHATAQERTALNETETPSYTLVNATLDWHPFAANPSLSLSLAANNIFDVVARRSTSILKDYAPLAGRDIRVNARLGF